MPTAPRHALRRTITEILLPKSFGTNRHAGWPADPQGRPFHPFERMGAPGRSPRRLHIPKMMDMQESDYTADTSKEALEVQLACLRQMSPGERIRQTLAMSRRVRNMAMDAIRRRHPDLEDAEVGLMFIELTYGKSLAENIRRWRAERVS